MSKKSQFKHLSTGSDALKQDLDALILNKGGEGMITVNPLLEARKKRLTKPVARPTRIKVDTTSTVDEPVEIEEGRGEAPVQEQAKPMQQSEMKTGPATAGPKKVAKPREVIIAVKKNIPEFDDFRSHSSLFSAGQLDRLRKAVYMKKATMDRKYSIKDAIAEAVGMLLKKRVAVENYPEDFITYTPIMSMSQFEELNSFVYKIKATKDERYAMKYAIYEALELYLKENPI